MVSFGSTKGLSRIGHPAKRGSSWALGALAALTTGMAAAPTQAQVCPARVECTYMPAMPPPPPASMTDPTTYGLDLLFASPDIASSISYRYGNVVVPEFGINKSVAAFVPLPPGSAAASAFGKVENSGVMMQAHKGYVMGVMLQRSSDTSYAARIRSHTSALGQRFRIAGFSHNASNGDDTGYDYVSVYAPRDCNVIVRAPAKAYAQLQLQHPGQRFWQAQDGPDMRVHMQAGTSTVLRTRGADPVVGAKGFPIDGALVEADARISVVVGGRGWLFDNQGQPIDAEDGADGLVPTELLGSEYIIKSFPGTVAQQVRVTTDSNNTKVTLNGSVVATLDAGDAYVFDTPSGVSLLTADKVIAVYQSASMFGGNNDMAMVQPMVFANLSRLVIPVDVLTGDLAYFFVVVPTASLTGLALNEVPYYDVPNTQLEVIPGHPEWTGVSFANVAAGFHILSGTSDVHAAMVTGNANPGTGSFYYLSRLRRAGCGDGIVAETEECDDGNIASFDGCSSMCRKEDNYVCAGEPSVCTMVQQPGSAHGISGPSDITPEQASCLALGCPGGQWCSRRGCVQRLNLSAACTAADQCVANICARDGMCGQPIGEQCRDSADCRSADCRHGACVDPNAQLQGDGLFRCNSVGRGGPLQAAEVLGLSLSALAWSLRLMWTRRARAWLLRGCLAIVGLSAGTKTARAADGFALSPLPVAQPGAPWLLLDNYRPAAATGEQPHVLHMRLGAAYADRPLVVRAGKNDLRYGNIVAHQASVVAALSYWWRSRLRLSLHVPLQAYASGQRVPASPTLYAPPRPATALGNVQLSAAWVPWRSNKRSMRTALGASVSLPAGNAASYAGASGVNGAVQAGLAGRHTRVDYALTLAAAGRAIGQLQQHWTRPLALSATAGLGIFWADDRWHAGIEVPLSTAVRGSRPAFTAQASWVDVLLSIRHQPSRRWAWMLGAGSGLTRAAGEAPWRLLAAVDFVPWLVQTAAVPPATTPAVASAPAPAAVAVPQAALVPAAPAVVRLPQRVQFALHSDAPAAEAAPILRAVRKALQATPDFTCLRILGFTDTRGPLAYNTALSQRRAEQAKQALLQLGVDADKLSAEGRGPHEFAADNDTRAGREANRRVEFELVLPVMPAGNPS